VKFAERPHAFIGWKLLLEEQKGPKSTTEKIKLPGHMFNHSSNHRNLLLRKISRE